VESPRRKIVSECWQTSRDYQYLLAAAHERRLPITFVNGCFDLFHSGHVALLHFAATESLRRTGQAPSGPLVVGLNSDASVRRLKGAGRPVLPWAERAAVVAAVGVVDAVIGFDEDTPFDLVADLKPRFLVKGSEYETKPVPEEAALPAGGAVLYLKRTALGSSSSWVAGRVIMSEAVRQQEARTLERRLERHVIPREGTDGR